LRFIDENGNEAWWARDLWEPFGYASWRNFQEGAIQRAMQSCKTTGEPVDFHFAEVRKMAKIGLSEAKRESIDYKLTRYACYLITQNGNSKIPEIAFGQRYFAIQTRRQEIMQRNILEIERLMARNKLKQTEVEFAKILYERGVDGAGIQEVRAAGDKVLFGGKSNHEMKVKLGLGHNSPKPLADVLPTVTIKAKDLAHEMTNVNTKKRGIVGKPDIKAEHEKNNAGVREALTRSNIFPEKLPPEEDIKKIETRLKKEQKALAKIEKKKMLSVKKS
jgi:DNA-damage-inducible protein D